MEKHLLTEINRMKGMMGLTLLSEQAAFYKKIIQGLTGVSDESAQSIAKSADEVGSEFGTALKQVVGGAGTYDDLVSYVSRQGGSVKSVDDIVNFVKSRPDLLKKIATSSDVIMKRAAESVFATSKVKDLFNPTSWAMVNKLLTSNTISAIDSVLKQLEQYKGKNSELDDLIQKLKDRKSIAEKMKSTPSVKVVDNVAGKAVDNVVGKVSDDLKIDMSKDDLLSVIDDVFPGNASIRQEIEKISEVDLKKSQDEFNKLSDEEVDNVINKVCGTLKEGFSIDPICGLTNDKVKTLIDRDELETKFYKGRAKKKKAKAEDIDSGETLAKSRSSRAWRYARYTFITLLAGGAYMGGKMAYDKFFTYDNTPEGFKKWVEKNNYTNPDYIGYWYTDNGTDKQASYSNGTWQ